MSGKDKRDPVSNLYRMLNARVVEHVEGVDPFNGYDPLAEVAQLAREWNGKPDSDTEAEGEP